jgi:rhodanese-related sulfurtransferase
MQKNSHLSSVEPVDNRHPRTRNAPRRRSRHHVAALLLVFVLIGSANPIRAADDGVDAQNRARIESMYSGYKKEFADVADIDVRDAMQLDAEGRAVFVDVRKKKERRVSMLPGAIGKQELLKDPEKFTDQTLIGYCTISYRSGKLARKLKSRGITMLNLRGGLLAWVHEGGKVYDAQGETKRIHVYGPKWNLAPKDYETVW